MWKRSSFDSQGHGCLLGAAMPSVLANLVLTFQVFQMVYNSGRKMGPNFRFSLSCPDFWVRAGTGTRFENQSEIFQERGKVWFWGVLGKNPRNSLKAYLGYFRVRDNINFVEFWGFSPKSPNFGDGNKFNFWGFIQENP